MRVAHQHLFPGLLVLLISVAVAGLSAEPLFEARVYRQDTDELLFYQYNRVTQSGESTTLEHFYITPDSSRAAYDMATVRDGLLYAAVTEFPQANEAARLLRQGDALVMQFEADDKSDEGRFDFPENLVVGPLFTDFIVSHWSRLMEGESISITLPAPRVMRLARFTLRRVGRDEQRVTIRMSVASIFLKLFIGSSDFVFDLTHRRLREIHGATILKTRTKTGWSQSTDASIYYQYLDEKE
jgi:hypothetical protein